MGAADGHAAEGHWIVGSVGRRGDGRGGGVTVPLPVRPITWVPTLVVMSRVALRTPAAVGSKVTTMSW